jgi:phospholipase C
MRMRSLVVTVLSTCCLVAAGMAAPLTTADAAHPRAGLVKAAAPGLPGGFKHLVVIYEENHSFDNLYGRWGPVDGQYVEGTQPVAQVAQDGTPFECLLQNDANLTAPAPLTSLCHDPGHGVPDSHFINSSYLIDNYIGPNDTTCPQPGQEFAKPNGWLKGTGTPGGCTRDLVHRFYQEQYQIDGGKMDRYVTGSDAVGLSVGQYDTKKLPVYQYLHQAGAPHYVIADNFFQAAFGGSYLNHQWLIAARTPLDTTATVQNSVTDVNGMPTSYPLYTSPSPATVRDTAWTRACPTGGNNYVAACGNYTVNTIQPASPPQSATGARLPLIDDNVYPNIGDRMTAAGISWNWYSGGWDAAVAGTPGSTFQYHHQPFNYFAAYAPGTPGRAHLQDETKFIAAAQAGTLPQVSFVKPYGAENEHPGYASEPKGSDHLVKLLQTLTTGPQAMDTLVVVTYDEFGGQSDHVAPPKVDAWGPGSRIPALLVSKRFTTSGVDHTQYDTTSILSTIEKSFGLAPLSTRDAAVNPLSVTAGTPAIIPVATTTRIKGHHRWHAPTVVHLKAKVRAADATMPTGKVRFVLKSHGKVVKHPKRRLNARGVAKVRFWHLKAGHYKLRATYLGDTAHLRSRSQHFGFRVL